MVACSLAAEGGKNRFPLLGHKDPGRWTALRQHPRKGKCERIKVDAEGHSQVGSGKMLRVLLPEGPFPITQVAVHCPAELRGLWLHDCKGRELEDIGVLAATLPALEELHIEQAAPLDAATLRFPPALRRLDLWTEFEHCSYTAEQLAGLLEELPPQLEYLSVGVALGPDEPLPAILLPALRRLPSLALALTGAPIDGGEQLTALLNLRLPLVALAFRTDARFAAGRGLHYGG